MRFTRHTEAETFDRKEMVRALGAFLGVRPHYEGMPTKAYTVGAFTVDFEGAIIGDDFTPIREFLISGGYAQPSDFEPEATESENPVQAETVAAPVEPETDDEAVTMPEDNQTRIAPISDSGARTNTGNDIDTLSISMPATGLTVLGLKNLVFMLYTKQVLLNHAIGADMLMIHEQLINRLREYTPESMEEFSVILKDAWSLDLLRGFMYEDGKVTLDFPLDKREHESWTLYAKLVELIVKCAKAATRTTPVLQRPENERYYMHSWLIRLGCGGPDHKALRHRMLQNLDGYCAFPDETRAQRHRDKYKEIRRIRREVNEEADRR